jgi:hypothetical protein
VGCITSEIRLIAVELSGDLIHLNIDGWPDGVFEDFYRQKIIGNYIVNFYCAEQSPSLDHCLRGAAGSSEISL